MFNNKKKPGMAAVLVMKGKNDPEAPEPIEKPQPTDDVTENTETPAQEGSEDYGAKLVSDMEAVGEKHGMDAEQTRAMFADLFGAMAECLRRDSGASDITDDTEDYPA